MPHRTVFTYRDYALLPEGPRYEVLEGDLVGLPAPGSAHQEVLLALAATLRGWAQETGAGRVLIAPLDVKLSDTDVLQPDLIFVTASRTAVILPEYVRAAPDLVVEVLSPSSAERDRVVKRAIYERHGVREYWIVDIAARAVEVHTLGEEGLHLRRTLPEGARLTSELLPALSVAVTDLFAI
jgi:Uma2 family endonuclease